MSKVRKTICLCFVIVVVSLSIAYFMPLAQVVRYEGKITMGNKTFVFRDNLTEIYTNESKSNVRDVGNWETVSGFTYLGGKKIWLDTGHSVDYIEMTCRHEMEHTMQSFDCIREHNCEEGAIKAGSNESKYPVCDRLIMVLRAKGGVKEEPANNLQRLLDWMRTNGFYWGA